MIGLCRKDFLISRFYLMWIFPFYLAQALAFSRLDEPGYYLVHLVAFYGMMALPVILEDLNSTDQSLCSLPLARSTIVYARYLYSLILAVAGVLLCIGYAYGLSFLMRTAGVDWLPPFSVRMSILTFLVLYLLVMIHLPFYFRYGLIRGSVVYCFAVLVFLFVLIGIQSLSGYLAGMTSAWIDPEYLRSRGAGIVKSLERAYESYGALLTYGLLSMFAAVSAFISMGISIHFYNEREF